MAAIAMLFWPGVAMHDTVVQYGELLKGEIDDWHPPVMVRLWQLVHPLGAATAPIFVIQVGLYAAGFSLIIASLVGNGRWRAGLAVLAIAISPLLLGWQMVVLKDAQMLGALIAAFAIVAHYRLFGREIPPVAAIIISILLAYATLVRANAVFATAPLIALILPRPRSLILRGSLALGVIAAVLALTPFIDHRLFGASASGIAKSQPLFVLAAIAKGSPGSPGPFTSSERNQIVERHCVKDFFWDPLGEPSACGPITRRVKAKSEAELYAELAGTVATHPLVYALHRMRHWNSTERWLVAPNLPDTAPPIEAEPNELGLKTPANALAASWQDAAAVEAATPIGWPIVWTSLGLFLLPFAWKGRDDRAGGLSFALLVSALMLEASFFFISIASDLRYHLWSITAFALALVLLGSDVRPTRGVRAGAGAALLFIIICGLVARTSLPRAPDSYWEMIHAPSG